MRKTSFEEEVIDEQPQIKKLFNYCKESFSDITFDEFCSAVIVYTATHTIDRVNNLLFRFIENHDDLVYLYHLYNLWSHGSFYEITDDLGKRLISAQVKRDIHSKFFKLPTDIMNISLPESSELYLLGNGGEPIQIRDIIVKDMRDGKEYLKVNPKTSDLEFNGDQLLKVFSITLISKDINEDGLRILQNLNFFFYDTETIEEAFCRATGGKMETKKIEIEDDSTIKEAVKEWGPENATVNIIYYIIKFLLYTNCSNVEAHTEIGVDIPSRLKEVKNPAKARKLKQRLERQSALKHTTYRVIGDNWMESTRNKDSKSGTKKTLEIVRPFFKLQHYGSGNAQTKIIWIDEYYRGEGSEPYRNNKFLVK